MAEHSTSPAMWDAAQEAHFSPAPSRILTCEWHHHGWRGWESSTQCTHRAFKEGRSYLRHQQAHLWDTQDTSSTDAPRWLMGTPQCSAHTLPPYTHTLWLAASAQSWQGQQEWASPDGEWGRTESQSTSGGQKETNNLSFSATVGKTKRRWPVRTQPAGNVESRGAKQTSSEFCTRGNNSTEQLYPQTFWESLRIPTFLTWKVFLSQSRE